MMQTIKSIYVNITYRCFLGYSLIENSLHFTTFNKNY